MNDEYVGLINNDVDILAAYTQMVKSRPRRVLAKVDYNHGVPFRSARCTEQQKETDVSFNIKFSFHFISLIFFHLFSQCNNNNDDDNPSWSKTFKKRMYDGYALALKRGKPVSFRFKGTETTLFPDQLTVDDDLIKIRMKEVVKEIKKLSHVSYFIYRK